MEVVIPILMGGSMYIMSKNSRKSTDPKSNDQVNNQLQNNESVISNSNPNVQEGYGNIYNVPPTTNKEPYKDDLLNNDTIYQGKNNNLDQYYNFNSSSNNLDNYLDKSRSTSYTSLTGEDKDVSNMKHSNMQPFFGSSVKQHTLEYGKQEGIMDFKIGDGSQF